MRLQKFMAQSGYASRRKSEEIIAAKRVKVNGKVVSEMGYNVDEDIDVVEVDGKVLKLIKNFEYYILNKPIGVVCSAKDEKDRVTVVDMIDTNRRIYPVGRLDIDTTGLVLLTDDGELTNKIIHPKHEIEKTYIATVEGTPNAYGLKRLRTGIVIEGRKTAPAKVKILKNFETDSILEVVIREGRNRQVKKMFEAVGHPVKKLMRIAIGDIKLGDLELGYYRKVTEDELKYLRSL